MRLALALVLALLPASAHAAAFREVTFEVVFTTPVQCLVSVTVALDAVDPIEHRLVVRDGVEARVTGIEGSVALDGPAIAGDRARVLRLRPHAPGAQRYRIGYEVTDTAAQFRCPLPVPAIPMDGRSSSATIRVRLPAGAVPSGGTLPALTWDAEEGTARLSHIPSFVRVPFGLDGPPAGLSGVDIMRVMDMVAIGAMAGATGLFAWRRRRS